MKTTPLLVTLCLSLSAFAQSNFVSTPEVTCQQEAQIIAKVSNTNKEGMSSCLVQVNEILQYNASQVCPLNIAELNQGIEVGMKNGHDCALEAGDILSGIVIKNASGVLILE